MLNISPNLKNSSFKDTICRRYCNSFFLPSLCFTCLPACLLLEGKRWPGPQVGPYLGPRCLSCTGRGYCSPTTEASPTGGKPGYLGAGASHRQGLSGPFFWQLAQMGESLMPRCLGHTWAGVVQEYCCLLFFKSWRPAT